MRLRERLPAATWIAVLLVVLAFVFWDRAATVHRTLDVSQGYGVMVDPPGVDPASRTGYTDGRRSLLVPGTGADTCHWIMQTQEMLAGGGARIRRVEYDNAPRGREVHWASPVRWWLGFLAWIDHQVSGRPIGIAVERASLVASPILLVFVLLGITPLLARRFHPAAAALFALGTVAAFPFHVDFTSGYVDHHGVANVCSLLVVLCLCVAADSGASPLVASRCWVIASAVAGGVGLWISAATIVPVLVAAATGIMLAAWLSRGTAVNIAWIRDPAVLRWWGLAGGATGFTAWLIEYFPSHLEMRLEVNHPLHALAWMGGGELLVLGVRICNGGLRTLGRRDLIVGGCATLGVLAAPVTMLLTGTRTFAVADPFLWRLHGEFIAEFRGLAHHMALHGFSWGWLALCLPTLLVVPALVQIFRRSVSPTSRALLVFALTPAVAMAVLGWWQIRWLGLSFALVVPPVATFFGVVNLTRANSRRSVVVWTSACVLLLAPGLWSAVRRTRESAAYTAEDIHSLVIRDIAHWLRLRAGAEPVVVAGSPTPTTTLIYYGSNAGLASLYWENAEGLKNAAAIFAAPSAEAARTIVERLGVTHLVFLSWDSLEIPYVKMLRDLDPAEPIPADAFVVQLLGAEIPPSWLRRLPFRVPDHPVLQSEEVRIWEVTDDRSERAALVGAAAYQLELGSLERAGRLAPALARFGGDLAADTVLAGIEMRRGNREAAADAFGRVVNELSQAAALSLEAQIHLAVVLVAGGRLDLARGQLQRSIGNVDELRLRRLTPGTLSDLLSLGDALGVALPDPELKKLAASLVPPALRH